MGKRSKTTAPAQGAVEQVSLSSAVPADRKTSDRSSKTAILSTFFFHFRPRRVAADTLALTLSWGLGGMAAVLVVLQFGTGLLLKFVYEPTPTHAYPSILHLQNQYVFGQLVRNLHHWSANLIVLIVFLHLLRVFFTGGFQKPRRLNWIVGLTLLATLLTANFTGYLLPYDQLGYWAVTVSTAMLGYVPLAGNWLQAMVRGGPEVGAASLKIFYAVHTLVVPAVLAVLMGFHFWRVRKAGGLVVPRRPGQDPIAKPARLPAVPFLLTREAAMSAVILAVVLLISVFFNAPLEAPANPGLSPNPTKAPWYFAGLQELLVHLHPAYAVCVVPLLLALFLMVLPYLRYPVDTGGIWFASRRGRRISALAAAAALIITPALILVDDLVFEPGRWGLGLPPAIGSGFIPVAVAVLLVIGFFTMLRRYAAGTLNEAVQGVFVLVITTFLVLTATGVWFRGKGMALSLAF